MTGFIKELIKEYKDDLDNNRFTGILYRCPPILMQELLNIFYSANIVVPESSSKIYADVCCFLSTQFETLCLSNVEYTTDFTLFTFKLYRNLLHEPQQFIETINNIGADLTKIQQDLNGVDSTMTIRIWN